jgi:gliding motility-associated-like protein
MSNIIKRFNNYPNVTFDLLKVKPFNVLVFASFFFFLFSPNQLYAQTPAPTGTSPQTFCEGATVASLVASGTDIKWYSIISGGSELPSGTALANNTTYYASQTLGGIESTSRLAVLVYINVVTGGTIGSDQTYCFGDTPLGLTSEAPAPTGSNLTFQWYTSIDGIGFSAISDGTGTNIDFTNTTLMLSLNVSFADVYYRRQTISTLSGVACSAESNVVLIQRDNIGPVPDVANLPDVNGGCSVGSLTDPTATDNCDGTITGTTTASLPITTTTTITWTYTDGYNNTSTQTQEVIIADVTPPVPDAASLPTETAVCSVASLPTPSATDACSAVTVTHNASFPITAGGTTVVTWTYTDAAGNSSTQNQNVDITDSSPPVPDVDPLPSITEECAISAPTPPTATDNCAGSIIGTTTTTFPITTVGAHAVTWEYDDGNGNLTYQTQNMTMVDGTLPLDPNLPTITGECTATAPGSPTTTDACAGTIIGTTSNLLTYTTQGTHPITWVFDDGNGNVRTVTQNVVIDDITPPSTPSLPVLTGECSVTATTPTTTDACAGTITGTTSNPLTYSTQGTYVITWNFDDGNGQSIDVLQYVIITDVTAPVPDATNLPNLTGQCSVAAPTAPTATDACTGLRTGTTTTTFPITTQGTTVVTWIYTDGNGNSSTQDQTVIIDDNTDPVTPTLADVTGACSATATAPTTTDACAGTITGTTSSPLTYLTEGTHIIGWTFDDGNGNIITVNQNVIINDVTNPVTPTLANVTGECSASASVPTTTDVCAGTIIGTTTDAVTYSTQGTHIITWTFDDGNGNIITVPQNVIITDLTDPVTPVLPTIRAECTTTVVAPTTTDVCEGTITGTTANPLAYSVQGNYVIIWNFADGNGNDFDVAQDVIIDDVTGPVPDLLNLAVLTDECSVAEPTAPIATDACVGAITGTHTTTFPITTQGSSVITWTYNDGNGNITTQDQSVIINDITKPSIGGGALTPTPFSGCNVSVAPAKETVAELIALGFTISDNCNTNAQLTVSHDDEVTEGVCPIIITRTYWVTDLAGNVSRPFYHVISIEDNVDPRIDGSIAPSTVQGCDISAAPAVTSIAALKALGGLVITDCNTDDNLDVSHNDNVTIISACSIDIERTYTVTDPCGNTDDIVQNIYIRDTEEPKYTGSLSPTTIEGCSILDKPAAATTVAALEAMTGNLQITDCQADATLIVHSTDVFTPSCPIEVVRTYYVEDACGNRSLDFIHTIYINDNTDPTAPNPAPINAQCLPAPDISVVIGEADNCTAIPIVAFVGDAFSENTCPEIVTRTYSVTDDCGNSIDVTQLITVNDITLPTASDPATLSVQCIEDAVVDITVVTDEADNCTSDPLVEFVSDDSDGNSCPETITRIYSVSDDCGNRIEVTQIIIVDDNTDPTAPSLGSINVQCLPEPDINLVVGEADNCTRFPIVAFVGDASDGLSCPETITRTYSVTDDCGNSIDVTQTIIVNDITLPTASNPASLSVQCISDVPAPNILVVTDEADNCTENPTVALVSNVSNGSNCPEIITRTYSVTDDCGNSIDVTHTITVDDVTDPTASNPASLSVQCISDVPAPDITVVIDEADNCTAFPSVAFVSDVSDGNTCPEVITRTYSVTDDCGNFIHVTQTITVNDITKPTASDPASISVQCLPSPDISVVIDAADNCTTNPTVAFFSDVSDGVNCPEVITRKYSVTDDCGNHIYVDQIITVNDTTKPTATDPLPLHVECIGDAPVDITVVTDAADNCTANPIVAFVSDVSDNLSCPETITRTYSVTDDCGNSILVTQRITINDNTDPTAPIPVPLVVQCADDVPAPNILVVIGEADNCTANPTVVYEGESTDGNSCSEVITRTYYVTDDCGNRVNVIHTITVSDTIRPVASSPAPIFVQCIGDVPAPNIAVITDVADNCTTDPTVVWISDISDGNSCPEVITRTYSVTDDCGNSINITQAITISDIQDPRILGLITTTILEGCSIDDAPIADTTVVGIESLLGGLTITDNCTADEDISITSIDQITIPASCPIVITRKYTAADLCGNEAYFEHIIHIIDSEAPDVTGSINESEVEGCSVDDAPAAETVDELLNLLGDLNISDCNQDEDLIVTHVDNAIGTCPIVLERTYTVTDLCGNSSDDIVHIIKIMDYVAPVITGTITTSIVNGCDATAAPPETTVAGIKALPGDHTISDCFADADLIVTSTDVEEDLGECLVVYTRTYLISDPCGNSARIVHRIEVADLEGPKYTGLLADTTVYGCDISIAPAVTTVAALEGLSGNLDITDNCSADQDIEVESFDLYTSTCPQYIIRTYRLTDLCENTSLDILHRINIIDTIAPTFTGSIDPITVEGCDATAAPADTTVAGLEALAGNVIVSDDCNANSELTVSYSDTLVGSCPIILTRTYTVTDACGNTSDPLYQLITIEDTEAPQIIGIIFPSIIQGCDTIAAPAETTVAGLEALAGGIAIIDCRPDSALIVTYVDAVTDTALCSIDIIRTYTVTDSCGNSSESFVHNITISDAMAPQITGSITDTIVQGCDTTAFPAATTVAELLEFGGNLTVTDCQADSNLVVNYFDSFTSTCPISLFRTYTITDPCGNTSVDIVQEIYINDTIAPQIGGSIDPITVQGCDTTAFLPVTTIAGLDSLAGNLTITDCTADTNLIVSSIDVVEGICPILIKRTYRVTDFCGNISEPFYQIITIEDTIAPQITGFITDTIVQGCDSTSAPIAETAVAGLLNLGGDLTITDCNADSNLIISYADDVIDTAICSTSIVRTYMVTDPCGNSSVEFVHNISIIDTIAPIITGFISDTTVHGCDTTAAPIAETTLAGLIALPGSLAIADACSADSSLIVSSIEISSGICPIIITRTYTVTDPCGNISQDIVHIINITDTIAPQISGSIEPSDIIGCDSTAIPPATTVAELDSLAGNLLIIDACSADSSLIVNYEDVSVGTCPILITRTYTVTDACDNQSVPFYHVITINDTLAPQITGSISDTIVQGCDTTAFPAATTVAELLELGGDLTVADCTADTNLIVTHVDNVTDTVMCSLGIVRTYTITDLCGNISLDFVHTINIVDTLAPVVSGELDLTIIQGCDTIAAPAETSVAALEALAGDLTITDCQADSSLIVNSVDRYTSTCPIVLVRTYTVTDSCGNTSINFIHTFNIVDTIAPQITGSITDTIVQGCDLSVIPAATTVAELDSLDGNITITDCSLAEDLIVTHVDDSIGTCPILVIRNYTVTDPCGNASVEFVHIIVIEDTEAPIITGLLDTITMQGCDTTAAYAETTVAGLEALPGDLIITDCSPNSNLYITHVDQVTSTNQCSIDIIRTYTATDSCGNSSVDIMQAISIIDTIAPQITGSIAPSIVNNCEVGSGAIAATSVAELHSLAGDLTITDCYANEDLTVTHVDVKTGTCPIIIVRTYTVTDPCGNSSLDIIHVINIFDGIAPVVNGTIETSSAESCDTGDALPVTPVEDLLALNGDLTITDDCSPTTDLIVTYVDSLSGTCSIVINRTYTVTDLCGNSSVGILHIINVTDTEAPIFDGSIEETTFAGCDISEAPEAETTVAGLEALAGDLIITDACSSDETISVTHVDLTVGTCPTIIRYYTLIDQCGNFSEDIIHTIRITDGISPTASNPEPIDIECIENVPDPDIAVVFDAADNCTVNPIIEFVNDSLYELDDARTIRRIYRVSDNCENFIYVTQYININGLAHPEDDFYTIEENSQDNIFLVLENDSIGCDGWGEQISIEIVDYPYQGDVEVHDNNTPLNPADDYLLYTPSENYYTADSLVYGIMDINGPQSTATVYINFSSNSLMIPEGFSPNGDEYNEFFIIRSLYSYPANSIVIFDQYGNTVYEASPYQNDWNGVNMFTGNPLPQGTYYYLFDLGDGSEKRKGFVYLIR